MFSIIFSFFVSFGTKPHLLLQLNKSIATITIDYLKFVQYLKKSERVV
nr:MAG TPA: hypothetical protein [Caudoviricetes sp.]